MVIIDDVNVGLQGKDEKTTNYGIIIIIIR